MVDEGQDWKDILSDELKMAPALKDIPDVQTLAKNLVDLQQHLGNSRRVPKADEAAGDIEEYVNKILADDVTKDRLMVKPDFTKDEQSETFFKSIGKPEKAEDYKIPEAPEGVTLNDDAMKSAQTRAFKYNMTADQFQAYVDDEIKGSLAQGDADQQAHETDIKGLRDEWGLAFDQNVGQAVGFAKASGAPEGLLDALKTGEADAATLKWLQAVSKQTGGETNQFSKQPGGAMIETPAELKDRQAALMRKLDELDQEGTAPARAEGREIYKKVIEINEKLGQGAEQ